MKSVRTKAFVAISALLLAFGDPGFSSAATRTVDVSLDGIFGDGLSSYTTSSSFSEWIRYREGSLLETEIVTMSRVGLQIRVEIPEMRISSGDVIDVNVDFGGTISFQGDIYQDYVKTRVEAWSGGDVMDFDFPAESFYAEGRTTSWFRLGETFYDEVESPWMGPSLPIASYWVDKEPTAARSVAGLTSSISDLELYESSYDRKPGYSKTVNGLRIWFTGSRIEYVSDEGEVFVLSAPDPVVVPVGAEVVPLPPAAALLLMGIAGIAALRQRRAAALRRRGVAA